MVLGRKLRDFQLKKYSIAEVGRGAGNTGAGGIKNKDGLMKWGNLFSGNP
jgi:hypothetical protein